MGNQGTKNWKLTALFAVSLMLIAGLFTSAAIAADGDGIISVEWTTAADTDPGAEFRANDVRYDTSAPLPAGSTENQLKFSYRVGTNMFGGQVKIELPGDGWKIIQKLEAQPTTEGVGNNDPYGRYANAYLIEVLQRTDEGVGDILYRLNRDGKTVNRATASPGLLEDLDESTNEDDIEDIAFAKRVTPADTSIVVDLGKEWRNGGELIVILRNVTAGIPSTLSQDDEKDIPYYPYEMKTFSKKSGIPTRLRPVYVDVPAADDEDATADYRYRSTQPFVRVGNILGDRDYDDPNDDHSNKEGLQYFGSDQVAREFKITSRVSTDPLIVYENEANKAFKITFEANGPMYSIPDQADTPVTHPAAIRVTIPNEVLPLDDFLPEDLVAIGDNDALDLYILANTIVTQSGSVKRSGGLIVETVADDRRVTQNLEWMDKGAKVNITYTFKGAPDYVNAADEGPVIVDDGEPTGGIADEVTAFVASTLVPTISQAGVAGTGTAAGALVTGGQIHPEEGSGTIAFTNPSDAQVEASTRVTRLELTYTAATVLSDVQLEIDVAGIVLDADKMLQSSTKPTGREDVGYGYVTGTDSDILADFVGGNTIIWRGLSFAKAGTTFKTTIQRVDIQEDGDSLEWTTRIRPDVTEDDGNLVVADALTKSPTLYITDSNNDAVKFTIDDGEFATYSAAEDVDSIKFTFTAVSTSIKGGQVNFKIPSSWDPKPTSTEDAAGETTVKIAGIATTTGITYGHTMTITVPELAQGKSVEIIYGGDGDKGFTMQPDATAEDDPVEITGRFWTSTQSGSGYSAGTVNVKVTQVLDGYGTATIESAGGDAEVKAGGDDNEIQVEFTAVGTMDRGAVSFEKATGWGDFQDNEPTEHNYIEVEVVGRRGKLATVDAGPDIVIAYLETFPANSVLRFTYGGGTVDSQNGAKAQANIDLAEFMIASDGDGDGDFEFVRGTKRTDAEIEKTPKPLGMAHMDEGNVGVLRIDVTGADDGSGSAEVAIVKTERSGKYPDDEDFDGDGDEKEVLDNLMRIHAGDTNTYLMFTYTASQTIQDGELKFTAHGDWSDPQSAPGVDGYTYVRSTGADTDVSEPVYDETDKTVLMDLFYIDTDGSLEIHYGAFDTVGDGSGAHAPKASAPNSQFTIEIKGGDATTNRFSSIKTLKGKSIAVPVLSQASGGGGAAVTDGADDLTAGGEAEIKIVYTAAGQIRNGMLKLSVPNDKWSAPTTGATGNVVVESTGSVGAKDAGGNYTAEVLAERAARADDDVDLGALEVHVDSVNLDADDKVTFTYSAAMVQPTVGDAATFVVAVDGGAGPGKGAMSVSADPEGTLIVSVGEAAPGSGSGKLGKPAQVVERNSPENSLTFIYTAVGQIDSRQRDFRVEVPAGGWSEPTAETTAKGSYTVIQERLDGEDYVELSTDGATVEKFGPFGMQMAARLKLGQSVQAGDRIIFTYENADAPDTIGPSTFKMLFGNVLVRDTDLTVVVGSGKDAAMLMVDVSADMILMEDDESVTVTVMLQDEDGNDVPATEDMDVMLESETGSFMVDGEAVTMVTIMQDSSSAMASYTDSTVGKATITASSGTLTAGTATVTVTTDVVEITSATVTPTLAKAGDTVTVSATGTAGKTPMYSVLNADGIGVQPSAMTEDEAGSYSDMFDVVVDHHPDGMYTVTVTLNGETEATALTIDSTAPTITAPSASPEMVANGEMVTISAMVDGATSVMADVSMLDTEADSVSLTDADGDGTYIGMHTISTENGADNGTYTITVTAMDAAGNSSDPVTAMVTLQNTLSFTSMIPAGISLFHVPLDVEGLDTVGDLEAKLGDNVNILITYDGTLWNAQSDDVMITATLGILVSLSAETSVTFEGHAWDDGSSMISLQAGSNLIGLPVDVEGVDMISHIMGLFDQGVVSSIIVSSGGGFQLVAAAGDAADGPVAGDAAYLVIASAAASAAVMGDGWMNGEMAGAAPIALAGYTVDNQTPVLDVLGSVVDEITGLAKEGFRVKAKNLSTKAVLSNVTSVEATDGYNMTFVDLADSYAARVGDVLEISADSPDPLLGIKPVRHIVTVDDVKNSRIQLEDLIAYEIPAETELLRNYPNPFNPETWIPYRLAEDANVSLTIYDTSGALVRSIDIGHQTAAVYETRAKAIYWDGRNQFGEQVASGLYFYHLSAGDDFSGTRRMVILK